MNETLTPAQLRLLDEVDQIAGYHGADCRDVLIALPGAPADKAAVAEQFGGAGAGAEFLELPADAATDVDTGRAFDQVPNRELICEWAAAGSITAAQAADMWPADAETHGQAAAVELDQPANQDVDELE